MYGSTTATRVVASVATDFDATRHIHNFLWVMKTTILHGALIVTITVQRTELSAVVIVEAKNTKSYWYRCLEILDA